MQGLRRSLRIASILVIALGCAANSRAVTFGPATNFPVGAGPVAVTVGDFNGDGKQDLAVANSGSTFVSILLGNGDGTFQAAINADAGGPQTSILAGDFNGDGKIDLVVNSGPRAAGAPHGVSILLGNGDGTFKPPVQVQTYLNNVQVAVGDFSLDGKLDLVVIEPQLTATDPAPFLNIFLGKGDGTFQPPTTIGLVGTSSGLVAVADFNGDGKPDVAAESGNRLRILLGIGDGTFQSPVVTTLGTAPLSMLVVGEFNRDNKQDLVTKVTSTACSRTICITISSAEILLSNGDGTFQVSSLGSIGISSLVADDFNGDGKLDVAVRTFGSLSIHLGKGDGTFPILLPTITLSSAPASATFADLNGDNLPDAVLMAGSTPNNVRILLNTSPTSGADLSVKFSSITDPVVQGQSGTYTAKATNQGPQDATGVLLTINLPTNSTFVSAVPTQGSCNAVQLTVTCDLGPLVSPAVAGATITLTPITLGSNTISASVVANEQDLNSADDMASATFTVIQSFTLTVVKAGAGGGTVTDNSGLINCGNTCSATYPSNATASLVAAADSASAFASWSGACTGTDPNSCSIPMTADMIVTATFVPGVPLTVTIAGAGAVGGTVTSTPAGITCSGANCLANFATSSTVNLTASAASGATFMSWSGACTGTDPNTCAVTMSAAQSVTANFNFSPPLDFMLNLSPVLSVAGGGQVPDTITLTPQNPLGSMVVSFTCSVSPPLAECSFSLPTVTVGAASASTLLTIVAIKPPGSAALSPRRPGLGLFASLWLSIPALSLSGIGIGSKHSRKKKMFARLLLLGMLCAGVISQSACGGGTSSTFSNFTPPGVYNVTVTAASGAIQHSTNVAVTVR